MIIRIVCKAYLSKRCHWLPLTRWYSPLRWRKCSRTDPASHLQTQTLINTHTHTHTHTSVHHNRPAHWPRAGAPRRRLAGICEAMASRLWWKACVMSLCCSSARRIIFLSGASVSSFSRSCSSVAARAKPTACCCPNTRATEDERPSSAGQRGQPIYMWPGPLNQS